MAVGKPRRLKLAAQLLYECLNLIFNGNGYTMRMLVTAGPTREYFDTVRFISNPSSGKMGFAIASIAAQRGHEVVLVSGPVELSDPDGVDVIHVESAHAMFRAVTALFVDCQCIVMTAAVCDYRPLRRLEHKLKKRNRRRPIKLVPTEDILAHVGQRKDHRVSIGFAMEDRDAHSHAEQKLKRKHCDAIVLNGLANVGSDEATIEILHAKRGWQASQTGTKRSIAGVIVELAEDLAVERGMNALNQT